MLNFVLILYMQSFEMAAYLSVCVYHHPHHFILMRRNFHFFARPTTVR